MARYAPTWNLDTIFPGGSASAELRRWVEDLDSRLTRLDAQVRELPAQPSPAWKPAILAFQELVGRLSQAGNYTECLEAQNTADAGASQLTGLLDGYTARKNAVAVSLENRYLGAADADWERLLADPELAAIAFALRQTRDHARRKMQLDKEILATSLAKDGYHAWQRLYDKLAGWLRVEFEQNGSRQSLSMGQVSNKMESADPDVRRQAFEKIEATWTSVEDLAAMALNNQAGFRLTLYGHRGWEDVLYEPLHINRLSRRTLDCMWDVVASRSAQLVPYLDEKARLLGKPRMTWYDRGAPLGAEAKGLSYDEAADYILRQFAQFSPSLTEFARMALEKRWIEAEDRSGKGAGGFCTDFPVSRETRIFMTFGGTFGSMQTLSHELGHAHHTWTLRERPLFAGDYPMTLAETASTFCETLVLDAAMRDATDDAQRLNLLDRELEEASTMMMNLRSRFLFETRFFERRARGPLTAAELSELMVGAQKEAYCGALAEEAYHPHFWASKLHFYITGAPFYNFPYVFGYLFSKGIYDRARQEGPSFARRYETLLEDTGSMTCEDLARKHLGVDLSRPDFWEASVGRAVSHVDEFVTLARRLKA